MSQGLPGFSMEVSLPLRRDDEETFAQSWARLSPKPAPADGLCLEAANP